MRVKSPSIISGAGGQVFALSVVCSVLLSVTLYLSGFPKFTADGITKQAVLSSMVLLCLGIIAPRFLRGSGLGLGDLAAEARPVVGAILVILFIGVISAIGNWAEVVTALQDVIPFVLFLSTFTIAVRADGLRPELLVVAGVFVGGAEVLVTSIAPFYVLSIPVCFAICVSKDVLWRRFLAGGIAIVWLFRSVEQEKLAQAAYGLLVLTLALSLLLSPNLRRWILGVAMAAMLAYVVGSHSSLILPIGVQDNSEVFEQVECQTCLSHRIYEAEIVRTANSTVAEKAIGQGFGGTVDLSSSPDTETLSSAGRNLEKVDDVHLFLYHYYLKVGFIGLFVLVLLLLGLVVKSLTLLMEVRRPRNMSEIGRIAAVLVVISAPVESFGASTHLFANPAFGVAVGLVVAKDVTSRAEMALTGWGNRRFPHLNRLSYGR